MIKHPRAYFQSQTAQILHFSDIIDYIEENIQLIIGAVEFTETEAKNKTTITLSQGSHLTVYSFSFKKTICLPILWRDVQYISLRLESVTVCNKPDI